MARLRWTGVRVVSGLLALVVVVASAPSAAALVDKPGGPVDYGRYCDELTGDSDCVNGEWLPDVGRYCKELTGHSDCTDDDLVPGLRETCREYLGDPDCVDVDPDPGRYCDELTGDSDCVNEDLVPDVARYCEEYLGDPDCVPEETVDHLIRSIANWDPLRDGFPNPTLDCNALVPIPFLDTDGDGTPDVLDEDDDCDHISDALEQKLGLKRLDSDSDGDRVPDHRDLTPLSDTEVAVAVRAVSLCVENVLTGPTDGLSFDDPYLGDTAGLILKRSDTPEPEHRLIIKKLTEVDHLHNSECQNYSDLDRPDTQSIVTLYQDILHEKYRKKANGIPELRVNLPLRDHDAKCEAILVGGTVFTDCPPGHSGHPDENTEDDEYLGKPEEGDVTWTLLSLAMATDKATSLDGLATAGSLSVDPILDIDYSDSAAIARFQIEVGTNASVCGILTAATAAPLDGTSIYITAADIQDKESATGVTCPAV